MGPANSVAPELFTVRERLEPFWVRAPDSVRLLLPTIEALFRRLIALATALAPLRSVVDERAVDAALIVRVPVPSAFLCPSERVPADNVIPPWKFAPAAFARINVPEPALVSTRDVKSAFIEPMVKLPALTVILRLEPKVAVPEPKLRSPVPVKMRFLEPNEMLLLLASVMAAPLVLSIVAS